MRSLPILSAGIVVVTLGLVLHQAPGANLSWDTVPGDGATVTPGDGTWDVTPGNVVWNDGATPNVVWANGNTPIFGGIDGTYGITVTPGLSAAGLLFNASGYTLSAPSSTTLATTGDLSVAAGKIATIGANLIVTRGATPTITGGGTLNLLGGYQGNGASNAQITGGTTVNVQPGGSLSNNLALVIGSLTTSIANNNGTLLVSGGSVTTTGAANLVLGNLVGAGSSTTDVVTISSGSITISSTATNGIRFGSTTQSSGTVTGTFNLDGGIVTTPAVSRVSPTSTGVINSTFNFNGGILRAAKANDTFFQNIGTATIKAGGAHIDTNHFNITIAQNLLDGGGGGGLEKLGAGGLTLTGTNTYTGITTISAGALQLSDSSLGPGPIVNNGIFIVSGIKPQNLSNTISGSGEVDINGPGTVTLAGTNTYTGPTMVFGGRLNVTGSLMSNITMVAPVPLGGEGSTTGSLTFSGTNILFFDPNTPAALSAASVNASSSTVILALSATSPAGTGIVVLNAPGGITGTAGPNGNFRFTGRGVTYLNSNSTQLLFDYTPATLKWKGNDPVAPTAWDVNTTANWLNGASPDKFITGDAVVFDDSAASFTINVQTPSPQPGVVTFNNVASTYTLQGSPIAGTGSVVKNGAGMVTIASANTYTGGTTINAGTVQLGNTVDATGDLGLGPVVNNATVLLNYGLNNATLPNDFSGTGTLAQNGTGIVSLTGTGTFTGTTTVALGTLQLGAGGTSGSLGTGPIVNNSTLAFNRTDNFTVANVISGPGAVTKLGSGTVTLGSANTFSGPVFINAGALLISANGTPLGDSSSGTTVSGTGAALQLQGGVLVTGEALTIAGDGVNGTSAPGALRNLSGNNEWAGSITVNPAATTRVVSDSGNLKISGPVFLSSNSSDQFVLQGTGTGEISGVISGNSRVTRSVTGGTTWILSGANTYTGKTTISNGALSVSSLNSVNGGAPLLPSSSLGAPQSMAAGTIDLGGTSGATILPGALIYTGPGETTDRVINLPSSTGSGTLDQSGTGLLKFTSDLTAAAGTKNFILQGSTAGTGEFAGIISNGSGIISLVKNGTGRWTLSGADIHTGATTITAGTLALSETGALSGTSSINVAPDAIFDVTAQPSGFTLGSAQSLTGGTSVAGRISGTVFAAAGSTISPGAAAGAIGKLSVSNGLAVDFGGHLAFDLSGNVPGTGYDQLLVTGGAVSLNGDLTGSALTFTPANFADVFYLIVNSGPGPTTGMLNGVGEGGSIFLGSQEFRVSYTSDFGGAGFKVNGTGNDVALLAVPEPTSTAICMLGLLCLLPPRRSLRRAA